MLKNSKLTKQRIAAEIFSNVKSLKAARENYVDCFNHIFDYVKNNGMTEESAITSLK